MAFVKYEDITCEVLDVFGSDRKMMQKLKFDEQQEKWEFRELKEAFSEAMVEHNNSIFEFGNIVLRITCPVFIAKRIVRHKGLNVYEVSRSKKFGEPEFYIPLEIDSKEDEEQSHLYEYVGHKSMEMYNNLRDKGVLPFYSKIIFNETVMTTLYVNASVMSLLRFANARLRSERELSKIANIVRMAVHTSFPAVSSAFWSNVSNKPVEVSNDE